MKKRLQKLSCLLLGAAFVLPIVACDKDDNQGDGNGSTTHKYDPETRPLTMSTTTPDGNFNPFFATSQPDNNVIAHTQISMLSIDSAGNSVCGDDYDTVARDYSISYYDKGNVAVTSPTTDGTTEYKFLIKNGIKYSNGSDLTIKDVLFNLYVYLDPAYSGSSTIYSTKIEGLQAYRTQDETAGDTGSSGDQYTTQAASVIMDMRSYYNNSNRYSGATSIADITKYGDVAKTLYKDALVSSYNGIDVSTYQNEYRFTEIWHAFFFECGYVEKQSRLTENMTTEYFKDADGKFYTTLDEKQPNASQSQETALIEHMQKALEGVDEANKANAMRDAAVKYCYDGDTGTNAGMAGVVGYVSGDLATRIAADLRKDANQTLKVSTVTGVTASKTNDFNGKHYDDSHEVLTIRVKGVDAKAIYNFSFAVAPMYYYGGTTAVSSFNYPGVDGYDATKPISAGVKWSDTNFFNEVLSNETVNALPVGAGPYKAANSDFNDAVTSGGKFYDNVRNYVYFVRNDNFHTVGANINNAKIRKLQYRVATGDNIVNLLTSKSIDFGEPDAKSQTVTDLSNYSEYLGYKTYDTGGYGYIGINPKAVESVYIRRAIMKAMNTNLVITQYYSTDLASLITRPMSKTSWAYPNSPAYVSEDGTNYAYNAATVEQEIKELVAKARNDSGKNVNLKLTFTIAGESTDHPAYAVFQNAEQILERCGFDITVTRDVQALSKLARGELEIWAAAWSSSVDPDMYQVYHRDSKATSVKNWNYEAILSDSTNKWKFERDIIYKLSDVIDSARESTNQATRSADYKIALDYVMELAVEMPTYQRKDLSVYNIDVLKVSTMNQSPNNYRGLIDQLWELDYN